MAGFQYTIEDVDNWIGCSDESAKKVWLDSDFAQNMKYYATGVAIKHFGINDLRKKLPHDPLSGVKEEINDISFSLALEISSELKNNKVRGDFVHIGGFINWVKIALSGRIIEKIKEILDPIPIDDGIRIKNPDSDSDLTGWDMVESEASPNPEDAIIIKVSIEKGLVLSSQLLTEFKKTLGNKHRLKNRLELLEEASGKDGPIGVILFLEQNCRHLLYRKYALEKNGGSIDDSVWNGYNRTLRLYWIKFLNKKQKEQRMEELMECIEWFSRIICKQEK